MACDVSARKLVKIGSRRLIRDHRYSEACGYTLRRRRQCEFRDS